MSIREQAAGRWPSILQQLGVPEQYLRRRNGPCPICGGGRDRFCFNNKQGLGLYYCNQCGPGDGFTLIMKLFGWDFKAAATEIEKIVGRCPVSEIEKDKDPEKIKEGIRRIWKGSKQPEIVDNYLRKRGLSFGNTALRGNPAVKYIDEATGEIREDPSMVALVQDPNGKVTTLHRTILPSNGKRIKKFYKVVGDTWLGGAVRLFEPQNGFIALAEGIETALAVYELEKIPVWAAVSAGGLEAWRPPAGINRVSIFGDGDSNFVGQKAAYTLAQRLAMMDIHVEVHIPKRGDFLDLLIESRSAERLQKAS